VGNDDKKSGSKRKTNEDSLLQKELKELRKRR